MSKKFRRTRTEPARDTLLAGESARQSLCHISAQRKVRAPQSKMPANGRAPRGDGKCHRKYTAEAAYRVSDFGRLAGAMVGGPTYVGGASACFLDGASLVRVKWCGKSAPRPRQRGWQGKPHLEQDRVGSDSVARAASG